MENARQRCERIYGINRWGEGFFVIDERGRLCAHPDPGCEARIDLVRLAERLREDGMSLPVLLRFNDILRVRVRALESAFADACRALGYRGGYQPVYPIKVNQQASVVREVLLAGNVGLEAGSKPELIAVLGLSPPAGLVICNGHKDRKYVRMALMGRRLGMRVHIVVEKLSEVPLILEESTRLGVEPLLGVRVRLASVGTGHWQKGGGDRSKFGLSANQLLDLTRVLESAGKLHWLRLRNMSIKMRHPGTELKLARKTPVVLRRPPRWRPAG